MQNLVYEWDFFFKIFSNSDQNWLKFENKTKKKVEKNQVIFGQNFAKHQANWYINAWHIFLDNWNTVCPRKNRTRESAAIFKNMSTIFLFYFLFNNNCLLSGQFVYKKIFWTNQTVLKMWLWTWKIWHNFEPLADVTITVSILNLNKKHSGHLTKVIWHGGLISWEPFSYIGCRLIVSS